MEVSTFKTPSPDTPESQRYAEVGAENLAATHKPDGDDCSSCTTPPTPDLSTSKHDRDPRLITASHPEETAGTETGLPPPWEAAVNTTSMDLGSVSQHIAGSDEAKEQHASTLPGSIRSICWAMP